MYWQFNGKYWKERERALEEGAWSASDDIFGNNQIVKRETMSSRI